MNLVANSLKFTTVSYNDCVRFHADPCRTAIFKSPSENCPMRPTPRGYRWKSPLSTRVKA